MISAMKAASATTINAGTQAAGKLARAITNARLLLTMRPTLCYLHINGNYEQHKINHGQDHRGSDR